MSDTLLALIPQYGVALIFAVVALSCLAVPLPASALVLGSGAFAAVGDLVVWQVAGAAFAGFIIGDQAAYRIGKSKGRPLLERMKARKNAGGLIMRAERMLANSGMVAVFLSRTVISPLGPYMAYLAGAGGLAWGRYTMAAVPGAVCWSAAYTSLGYGVADQLEQSTGLVWNALGAVGAVGLLAGCVLYLRRALRRFRAEHSANPQ